ncbi:hypothetical protein H0H93_001914 [Arthromyces matolae]|nr:hypothetical protein H0H93_001914 [Arthromyces matolae]
MSQAPNSTLSQPNDDPSNAGRVVIKIPATSTHMSDDATPGDSAPAVIVPGNVSDLPIPLNPPIPTAPPPALNPSTERRMTRQSDRMAISLATAKIDTGSDPSMDESLRSFFQDDTSIAAATTLDDNAPVNGKGKGKVKAVGSDKEKTVASGSGLSRSPSKTESAAAGVRRMESRVSSLADIVHGNTDELAQLRSHIQSIAEDVREGLSQQPRVEGRTVDLVDDPSFQELARANNHAVSAIDSTNLNMERVERSLSSLERRIAALEPHMQSIYVAIDRLDVLAERLDHRSSSRHALRSNSPEYSRRPVLPKSSRRSNEELQERQYDRNEPKRRRTSSRTRLPEGYDEEWYQISGTIAQPPFRGSLGSMAHGPIYEQPVPNDTHIPHAPPAPMTARATTATGAVNAPGVPHAPNAGKDRASVIVGKVTWGRNTTGGFKAIMDMMPALNRISRTGIRAIRIPGRADYVRVNFGSDIDAVSFTQIWTTGPRPADYENVTAVLEN